MEEIDEQVSAILAGIEDIRHPYYDIRLSDAVKIALNSLSLTGNEGQCKTLADVRTQLLSISPFHNWITGAVAMDLVDNALGLKHEFSPW